METKVLEDLGMSQTEIKIFLKLLEGGELKSGKIIELTGLQSSSVFSSVNSMIKKGFVSYIRKNKTKYYRASNPETILRFLELKKEEYLRILPELKERQKSILEEGVEFFKSYKGIKALILELIKDAKKGDILRGFVVEDKENYNLSTQKIYSFIKPIIKEKKITQKLIFPEANRINPKKDTIVEKKYLSYPLPPNTTILNNKIAIISWDEEPSGILLTSKSLAEKYIAFFDHLWEIAKK
jgi:sugar-specific transcriptional regulator TrmB